MLAVIILNIIVTLTFKLIRPYLPWELDKSHSRPFCAQEPHQFYCWYWAHLGDPNQHHCHWVQNLLDISSLYESETKTTHKWKKERQSLCLFFINYNKVRFIYFLFVCCISQLASKLGSESAMIHYLALLQKEIVWIPIMAQRSMAVNNSGASKLWESVSLCINWLTAFLASVLHHPVARQEQQFV